MEITPERIEAVARAIRATTIVAAPSGWDDVTEELRQHYRQRAVVVLEAVARVGERQ